MKRAIAWLGAWMGAVVLVSLFASTAFAQEVVSEAATSSAFQIFLQQGITGAIALVFLTGYILKDRQITSERAAWQEKLLAISISHAADTAKTTAQTERITLLMDRIARHFEKGGQ